MRWLIVLTIAISSIARAETRQLTAPIATVSFPTELAALDDPARSRLLDVAAWARANPWRLVVVQGFSDPTGDPTIDIARSQDLADAVVAQLIEDGVPPRRIVSAAYGSDEPGAARVVVVRGTQAEYRALIERQRVV